jgi:DNA-binding response OmpR family regulator
VLPPFKGSEKHKIIRRDTAWVRSGKKLENLQDLCSVANEIAMSSNTRQACIAVGDVLIRENTWTFSIGPREISLGPITAALFRVLLMNANHLVSNEKLMRCVPEDFDLSDVCKRIYILRTKLGNEDEWRIRTVRGAGYMYVVPAKHSARTQPSDADRLCLSLQGGQTAFSNHSLAIHGPRFPESH